MHNAPCSCLGHHQKNYLTGGQKFRSAPKALFSLFVPNSDGLHFGLHLVGYSLGSMFVIGNVPCSVGQKWESRGQKASSAILSISHGAVSGGRQIPTVLSTAVTMGHGSGPYSADCPPRTLSGGCSQPGVLVPRVQRTYLLVTPLPIGKAIGLL